MGNGDAKYTLDGIVEFDDAFFAGHRQKPDEQTGFVPKEIDRNEKVLVAVNVVDSNAKYLKMTVVQSLQTKVMNCELPTICLLKV
jgi:hypothetical protein